MTGYNWLQRLYIDLGLDVPVGKRHPPSWSRSLMFYAFQCPADKHGIVENYPQGHSQILRCPECIKQNIRIKSIT